MASAPQMPAEQAQPRPSFAKVAASALRTQSSNDKAKPPVATPRTLAQSQNSRPAPITAEVPRVLTEKNESRSASDKTGKSTAAQTGQWTQVAGQPAILSSSAKDEETERPRSATIIKVSAAEDNTTQLSSSDDSAKPPSVDGGKSVTSATTFALDEKESLRPDDSASLRAVEEEDVASTPDSAVADSRHGSDNGAARAFRDQLHEIAVMNPQPQRGGPPGRFPTLPNGPHTLYDPNQLANGARPMSQSVGNGIPLVPGGPALPATPDEKLIEALQSPRDRLFVVKIEQDFIDFIKDPREHEYSLPNCNTFYRMLAHRLADYYLLGHVVDTTMTGVKITRTPYCRIPPPLSQMVDPAKSTDTPPVELPARKIMRRDDGKSGTNTTANSRNPSKTTSENGGSDGSDENGKEKDKGPLTREEREARYREARQRIFGNVESEENESAETTASGEEKEKDVSRSNSASGKKKSKKQRNYDDDDFQARSRFNAYYPPQYPTPGYSGDNVVYYNGFPGPMPNPQYANMNPGASPPSTYSNPYPVMVSPDAQPQYGWSNQQYQPPNAPMGYPNYAPMQNGYDLSADFQRGMSSFQNAGMPSQVTPKMANTMMAPYQDSYPQSQHMPMNQAWSPMNQQPSYPIAQGGFTPSGPGNRPMSAPHQGPMQGSYPYGQFPSNQYNGKANRNQHPIPGSYNRQQFNPQSQAFVPGGRNMPFQMQQNMGQGPPQMNGYGGFQMPGPNQMPQMPRPGTSSTNTPSFGSPQSMQGNHSSSMMNRIQSQPGEQAPSNGTSAHSSIAKYGTPAHLPAKPPAPQQSTPKFPSMTRVPSNMASGLVNNAPVAAMRNGAGPNDSSNSTSA